MRSISLAVLAFALLLVLGSAATGLAGSLVYNFPLNTDPGWTMGGGWNYGPPNTCCSGYLDHTVAHTGENILENGSGGAAEEYLSTGALDCSDLTGVKLRFWRVMGLSSASYGAVQVSNDGSVWTTVWEKIPTGSWCGWNDGSTDCSWTLCEYDISAVADNQPTVYVRWLYDPNSCACWGWKIDDIQILADTSDPPLQILAWVPYADLYEEYANTLAALSSQFPNFVVTESLTLDPGTLADELEGKHVFLVPEPENAGGTELADAGAAFASTLQDFVELGGTVIVCCEWESYSGFMTATGLMTATYANGYWMGEPLPVVYPGHPLAAGLGETVAAQDATGSYTIGPEATAVIEDGLGNAVLAFRDVGYGAAIMVGYDYYAYDDSAARVIANAVQYPRSTKKVLVFDANTTMQSAMEAVARLGLPYTRAGAGDFNALLASQDWDAVLVDAPSDLPGGYPGEWDPLISYVHSGGRVALSTWDLTSQPDLTDAFGANGVETLGSVPPIYLWEGGHIVFHYPQQVPDLINWADRWGDDADRLIVTSPIADELAGFIMPPEEDQAALVIGNLGTSLLNGFLWDDRDQDANANGIEDCVELIMNETMLLLRRPEADFTATPTGGAVPLDVTFTDQSQNLPSLWCWDFGDGTYSEDQNPAHQYASPGVYEVSLVVANWWGWDCVTKSEYIHAALAPVANFEATPTSGAVPLLVAFTDESTNSPSSWLWDFGDGGTSTEQNPSHQYAAAGTYTVSLTVTNAAGSDSETKTEYIIVAEEPGANFSGSPTTGGSPLLVAFTDLSTNDPTAWSWDFGDGGTSTARNPSHLYVSFGTFTVTLMASNAGGADTEVKTDYITVVPEEVDFWGQPLEGTNPMTVAFTGVSEDSPSAWHWEFGDGGTSSQQNPSHQYAQVGFFTVSLAATTSGGSNQQTKPRYIAVGFPDVPPAHWAFRKVIACYDAGIVTGYPDGTYQPDVAVSRDQMAVYISRALAGGDAHVPSGPADPTFADVGTNYWAYRYIEYAEAHDIVTGYPDGLYHPADIVDRGQMAVFIARAMAGGDSHIPTPVPPPTFPDVTGDNDWAWCYRHVEYVSGHSVVQGYPDGDYHPEVEVTRDQMAVFVQRAFSLPM